MTPETREQIRVVLAEIRTEIQRLQYTQIFKKVPYSGAGVGTGPLWGNGGAFLSYSNNISHSYGVGDTSNYGGLVGGRGFVEKE